MKLALLLLALALPARAEAPTYELGPDSLPQEGVPQGKVTRHDFRSRIFPDTLRQYYVYVPAQYEPGTEAALLVCQDGHVFARENAPFRAPVVLDNLIHRGELPVIIGVFVNPGVFTDDIGGTQTHTFPKNVRSNRAFEYDTLDDAYVRFLDGEILPEVEKNHGVKLSRDPARRAICGNSSGGIAAFTAAWQRPDLFGLVISHIGSFTNIRGGHVYPALVRAEDPKPIRVFLQDGSNDLDNRFGNWWLANLQMASSLAFKGYDHRTVWGHGGHNPSHAASIFPDTLRWTFRDLAPKPVDPDFDPPRKEIGSFVFVASPASGASVRSGFKLTGTSRTFESNVSWNLVDRSGEAIASGHTQGGGVDGPDSFTTEIEFSVAERQLGHLEVYEEDASDGEGPPPAFNRIPLVLEP